MKQAALATGLGLIAGMILGAAPASASSSRTYVSGTGSDSFGVASEGSSATMLLAGDTITGNTSAAFLSISSGVINSFGNNDIKGNPGGDGGTITTVAMK